MLAIRGVARGGTSALKIVPAGVVEFVEGRQTGEKDGRSRRLNTKSVIKYKEYQALAIHLWPNSSVGKRRGLYLSGAYGSAQNVPPALRLSRYSLEAREPLDFQARSR